MKAGTDFYTNPLQAIAEKPLLALRFITDNNPAAVQSKISGISLVDVNTNDDIYNTLISLVNEGNYEALKEVTSIPYLNNAQNYTGGFEKQLNRGVAVSSSVSSSNTQKAASAGLVILNVLDGAFDVTSGWFNMQASREQTRQAEIFAQMEEESKVFGLKPEVFNVVVATIGVVFITLIVSIALKK
jgi:hypothetical protein